MRVAMSAAFAAMILVPTALPTHAASTPPALAWGACADAQLAAAGVECATLAVPESRRDPGGPKVTLALARHRSTGTPEQRIGSVVFNPGGPGGSGVASIGMVWGLWPDAVKERFDLVTWDPRGVGATSPALSMEHCPAPRPDRPLTGAVDWGTVIDDFERTLAKANAECQEAYTGNVNAISTMQNVADLEAIRAALGEGKLTYWGMSYGTRIGYVYALQHPDSVRAMVLDGSIDPAGTFAGLSGSAVGPDQAFGSFAQAYPDAARGLSELLGQLDRRTLALPDGQRLDRWTLLDFVYSFVAHQSMYSSLAEVIGIFHAAMFTQGEGREAALARAAKARAQIAGAPNDASGGAFAITNCIDYADRTDHGDVAKAVSAARRIAPRYGATGTVMLGLGCSGLTVRPDPIPRITGAGSPLPVLILGSSRDGATIVDWTPRMSRAFPNSRTVTYAGGQHVVWGMAGSQCVNEVADRYVIDLVLPRADIGCPNVGAEPAA